MDGRSDLQPLVVRLPRKRFLTLSIWARSVLGNIVAETIGHPALHVRRSQRTGSWLSWEKGS